MFITIIVHTHTHRTTTALISSSHPTLRVFVSESYVTIHTLTQRFNRPLTVSPMQSFQFTPLFSPLSLSRCFSLSLCPSLRETLLLRCAHRFVGRDAASAEKQSVIFGFQLGFIERRFFSLIPSTLVTSWRVATPACNCWGKGGWGQSINKKHAAPSLRA